MIARLVAPGDAIKQTESFMSAALEGSLFQLEKVFIEERLDAYEFRMGVVLYLFGEHVMHIKTKLKGVLKKDDALGYYVRDNNREFFVDLYDDDREEFIYKKIDEKSPVQLYKNLSEMLAEHSKLHTHAMTD